MILFIICGMLVGAIAAYNVGYVAGYNAACADYSRAKERGEPGQAMERPSRTHL